MHLVRVLIATGVWLMTQAPEIMAQSDSDPPETCLSRALRPDEKCPFEGASSCCFAADGSKEKGDYVRGFVQCRNREWTVWLCTGTLHCENAFNLNINCVEYY